MAVNCSIIIPFRGDIKILQKSLQALEETRYTGKEIIIVNDATMYDFNEITENYKCSVIDLPKKHGPSFARNAGAKVAKYEYLIFLDSDIIVPKDCFIKINDFLNNNSSVSVLNFLVSPYSPHNNIFSRYANALFSYSISKKGKYTVFTSFCMVRAKSFWDVNGFDENISLPYADDTVLGWKLNDKGYKPVLLEGIVAIHYKYLTFLRFINWSFLHAYFYGKFYCIYRNKLNLIKHCLRKGGIYFFTAGIVALILLYYKVLGLSMFILTIFAVFIISHYKFIKFLLKENGYVFAVISMGVAIFQNIIYDIGGFMGIISGLFEKSK